MLSPAILNRSMPRTPASDMRCPPASVVLNPHPANFHLLRNSILGEQAHVESATCLCSNLESSFRSLRLIPSNLQPIYQKPLERRTASLGGCKFGQLACGFLHRFLKR